MPSGGIESADRRWRHVVPYELPHARPTDAQVVHGDGCGTAIVQRQSANEDATKRERTYRHRANGRRRNSTGCSAWSKLCHDRSRFSTSDSHLNERASRKYSAMSHKLEIMAPQIEVFAGIDDLLPGRERFPDGFRYTTELISQEEEVEVLTRISELPFREFEFHG